MIERLHHRMIACFIALFNLFFEIKMRKPQFRFLIPVYIRNNRKSAYYYCIFSLAVLPKLPDNE